MSYIDPDQLLGAMNDLDTFIADNAAALNAKGLVPATLQVNLQTINDDLSAKKGIRDKKKTELTSAQQDFAQAAADNYTAFSDLIDTVAGAVGKKTPAGDQVLGYRKHLNATTSHTSTPAPAATTPAK